MLRKGAHSAGAPYDSIPEEAGSSREKALAHYSISAGMRDPDDYRGAQVSRSARCIFRNGKGAHFAQRECPVRSDAPFADLS